MVVVMYDDIECCIMFHSKSVVNLIIKFSFSENLEFLQGVH
jgi:hypothetical protein